MATTTSTHVIGITDNGSLKQITAGANKAADAISGIERKSKAASKALAATESDRMGYDQARASVGTGAAGRDFAKQSQGLGGLVRVYATFAANLFAVSAAYNALSRAQDTANLVKGLDQLGAASGRNLGTLAKDIVKATDSAVSLREAMTATAQASAAGMSNKDILRMAEGAKKASQALGVDMPDALSRISRGITKLEPELLDEIGIFVRVDKAAQDYAKSVGKPVSALTDLEKRAAFANAALTQVEAKFGAINIDSNPYTKLLAQLKNVATEGLNLVNTVLGPLIGMLAQSPAALSAVLLGIGTILLKQAIPAIGMWREELKASALEAEKTANKINSSFTDFDVARKMGPAQAIADAATAEANMAISKVQTALGKAFSSNSKIVKNAMSASYDPEANQGNIDRQAKAAATKLRNLEEARKLTSNTDAAHLLALDQAITKQKQQLDLIKQASIQNILASQKMADSQKILDKAESEASLNKFGSEGWAREKLAKRASDKAQSIGILSNVGSNTQMMGMTESFKELFDEVNKGGKKFDESGQFVDRYNTRLTGLTRASTLARGSFTILTSTIGTLLNAFTPWIAAIGLAITGFTLLNSWMKDNAKEADAAAEAVDKLKASSDNLGRTLEYLAKLDPFERTSAKSLSAKASALTELSTALDDAVTAANKEINSRGADESFFAFVSNAWGGNVESKLAEQMADSVANALKIAGDDPVLQEAKNKLAQVTKNKTGEDLADLLEGNKGLYDQVVKLLKDLSKEANGVAVTSTQAANTTAELTKSRTALLNSFKQTDVVTSYGNAIIANSIALASALDKPLGNLAEIRETSEELSKIGLFPDSTIGDISKLSDRLGDLKIKYDESIAAANAFDQAAKKPVLSTAEIKSAIDAAQMAAKAKGSYADSGGQRAAFEEAKRAKQQELIESANQSRKNAQEYRTKIEEGSKVLKDLAYDGLKAGSGLVNAKIQEGFQKATTIIGQARLASTSNMAGSIEESGKLAQQEINAQAAVITMMGKLTTSGYDAAAALAKIDAKQTIEKMGASRTISPEAAAAFKTLEFGDLRETILKAPNMIGALNKAIDEAKNRTDTSKISFLNNLREEVQTRSGIKSQLAVKRAEGIAVATRTESEARGARSALNVERISDKNALDTANLKSQLDIKKDLGILSEYQYLVESRSIKLKELANAYESKQLDNANKLINATLSGNEENVQQQLDTINLAEARYKQEVANMQAASSTAEYLAKQAADLKIFTAEQTLQLTKAQELANVRQVGVDIQSEELEKAMSMGIISQDVYNARKADILTQQASLDAAKKRLDVEADYAKALRENQDKRERIGQAGPVGPEAYAEINRELLQINASRDAGISAINRATDATKRQTDELAKEKDIVKQLNVEATNFASDFADAMFDATQSGKYDFSQMVNSMISDLGRLIWKQSMLDLYKGSSIQSGISGIIGKLFGGGVFAGPEQLSGPGMPELAKGGAFDSGVEKFAKGGTFTNSIVNTPTLFKFAKGTGLMGEAGPEAIMPLKRDANGRLGVSGGSQGNTQVIVNNYSGQEVETKESIDSRGQRKIEVSIGDMVAGEIMRSGSMAQQSIKNTFGTKPQLIRR